MQLNPLGVLIASFYPYGMLISFVLIVIGTIVYLVIAKPNVCTIGDYWNAPKCLKGLNREKKIGYVTFFESDMIIDMESGDVIGFRKLGETLFQYILFSFLFPLTLPIMMCWVIFKLCESIVPKIENISLVTLNKLRKSIRSKK